VIPQYITEYQLDRPLLVRARKPVSVLHISGSIIACGSIPNAIVPSYPFSQLCETPSRLIQVSSDRCMNIKWKLIEVSKTKSRPKYAVLSLLLGKEPRTSSQLYYNDSEFSTPILFFCVYKSTASTSLPRTLKEAVLATSRFGLDFIWIDALCTLQDSPSNSEWKRQKWGQFMQMHISRL